MDKISDKHKDLPVTLYKKAYLKIWEHIFDIDADDEDLVAALKIACRLLHDKISES